MFLQVLVSRTGLSPATALRLMYPSLDLWIDAPGFALGPGAAQCVRQNTQVTFPLLLLAPETEGEKECIL